MKTYFVFAALALGLIACGVEDPAQGSVPEVLTADELSHADELGLDLITLVLGKHVFDKATFGGNGRTCLTCHDKDTGTLSVEAINERFAEDPLDPLFTWDGTDDFTSGTTRILEHGTFLVRLPLPPYVSLAADPSATSVVVRRGTPTTLNISLDPFLMVDGRQTDLAEQALGAVHDHTQNTLEPTAHQLDAVALFQRTPRFFSRLSLLLYSLGGPEPKLPRGNTPLERAGRRFFENVPPDTNTGAGICATCHSGPMLNEANAFNCGGGVCTPAGARFTSSLTSELNRIGNPVQTFVLQTPDGPVEVQTPDPGRALHTGNWAPFPFGDLNAFKTPTLWGVSKTAPYMHDNSLATLEDVADHYQQFFVIISTLPGGPAPTFLSEQDKAAIVAYLRIL